MQGVNIEVVLGCRSVLNSAVLSGVCIAAIEPPVPNLSLLPKASRCAGENGLTLITSQDVLYIKLLNTSGLCV